MPLSYVQPSSDSAQSRVMLQLRSTEIPDIWSSGSFAAVLACVVTCARALWVTKTRPLLVAYATVFASVGDVAIAEIHEPAGRAGVMGAQSATSPGSAAFQLWLLSMPP